MAKRLTKFNNAVVNEVVPDFVYYDGVRYDKAYYDGYVMFGLVDEETEDYDQESLTTEPPTQAETTVPPLVQDVCIAVIFNEIGPYGEGNGTPIYRYLPPSIQGQDYMLQLNVDEDSPFEVESVADVNIYRTNSVWVGDEFEFYDDGKLFIKIPKINDTYYFVYVNVTNDSSYNPPTHAPIIETHLDEGKNYTVDLHFKFVVEVPNTEQAEVQWHVISEDDLSMRAFGLAAYDSDLLGQWNNVGKGYMYHTMPIKYDSEGHYDGYASMVSFSVYDEVGECDMTNYVRMTESNGSFTVELMDFYPDQNDRGRMTVTVYTDAEYEEEDTGPTEAPTTPRPWKRDVEFFVEIYNEFGERYSTFQNTIEVAYASQSLVCDIPPSYFGDINNVDSVHVYDEFGTEITAQIMRYAPGSPYDVWRVYDFGNELDYYRVIVHVLQSTGYNAVIYMNFWDSSYKVPSTSLIQPRIYHRVRIDKPIDTRYETSLTTFDVMRSEFEGEFDDNALGYEVRAYGIDHIETLTGSSLDTALNATFRNFTFKYTLMSDRIRFYDVVYPELDADEIDRQGYALQVFVVTDRYAYEEPEPSYTIRVTMYDQNYDDVAKQTLAFEGLTPVNEFLIPKSLYGDILRIMNVWLYGGTTTDGAGTLVNEMKVESTANGIRFYDMDNSPTWNYFNVRIQVAVQMNNMPTLPPNVPQIDFDEMLNFTNVSTVDAFIGFWRTSPGSADGTPNKSFEYSLDGGETWTFFRDNQKVDYPEPIDEFYKRDYSTGNIYNWYPSEYNRKPYDWVVKVGPGQVIYIRAHENTGGETSGITLYPNGVAHQYVLYNDYFYNFGGELEVDGNIMSMPLGTRYLESYDADWWHLLDKMNLKNFSDDYIQWLQPVTTAAPTTSGPTTDTPTTAAPTTAVPTTLAPVTERPAWVDDCFRIPFRSDENGYMMTGAKSLDYDFELRYENGRFNYGRGLYISFDPDREWFWYNGGALYRADPNGAWNEMPYWKKVVYWEDLMNFVPGTPIGAGEPATIDEFYTTNSYGRPVLNRVYWPVWHRAVNIVGIDFDFAIPQILNYLGYDVERKIKWDHEVEHRPDPGENEFDRNPERTGTYYYDVDFDWEFDLYVRGAHHADPKIDRLLGGGCRVERKYDGSYFNYALQGTTKVEGNIMSLALGAGYLNYPFDKEYLHLLDEFSFDRSAYGDLEVRDGGDKNFFFMYGSGNIKINYDFYDLRYSYNKHDWYKLRKGDELTISQNVKTYFYRDPNPDGYARDLFKTTDVNAIAKLVDEGKVEADMRGWMTPDNVDFSETIRCGGDIRSLLAWDFEDITEIPDYGLACTFKGLNLLTPPDIGNAGTNVGYAGLFETFAGCQALVRMLKVYPNEVADGGQCGMYKGCTALTGSLDRINQVLFANKLGKRAWKDMFYGCTSLYETPERFNATTLSDYCCEQMYYGCTALRMIRFYLPAERCATGCYRAMFEGCETMQETAGMAAKYMAEYCYERMYYGCTALEVSKRMMWGGVTSTKYCCSSMFEGCVSLREVQAIDIAGGTGTFQRMFKGCEDLTEAPVLRNEYPWASDRVYYEMFMDSGVEAMPDMEITIPAKPWKRGKEWCYNMFANTPAENEWLEHVRGDWYNVIADSDRQ